MAKVDSGDLTEPTKLTVGDLCDAWLPVKAKQVKPSTIKTYEDHVAHQIKPTLGNVRLAKLTPAVIDAAYAKMRQADGGELSATSKQHVHRTLHVALTYALRKGLLAVNPADQAEKPKRAAVEMNVLDEAETMAFLTHPEVVGDRLFPAFFTLVHTGVRRGELCGLRWDDVDLDAGVITIRRSRASVRLRGARSQLQSQGSPRVVGVDPSVVEVLRDWKHAQKEERLAFGPGYVSSGYIFTNRDGTAIHPQALSDTFDAAVKRSGARRVRLHDLRHGHASSLLRAGVPVHVVARQARSRRPVDHVAGVTRTHCRATTQRLPRRTPRRSGGHSECRTCSTKSLLLRDHRCLVDQASHVAQYGEHL